MGFLWGPFVFALHPVLGVSAKTGIAFVGPQVHLIPFGLNALLISVPRAINMFDRDYFQAFTEWYMPNSEYLIYIGECLCVGVFFHLPAVYPPHQCIAQQQLFRYRRKRFGSVPAIDHGLGGDCVVGHCFSVYELNYPPIEGGTSVWYRLFVWACRAFFAYKGMWQAQMLVPEFLPDARKGTEETFTAQEPEQFASCETDPQTSEPVTETPAAASPPAPGH